jgi:hypothetical protein
MSRPPQALNKKRPGDSDRELVEPRLWILLHPPEVALLQGDPGHFQRTGNVDDSGVVLAREHELAAVIPARAAHVDEQALLDLFGVCRATGGSVRLLDRDVGYLQGERGSLPGPVAVDGQRAAHFR